MSWNWVYELEFAPYNAWRKYAGVYRFENDAFNVELE